MWLLVKWIVYGLFDMDELVVYSWMKLFVVCIWFFV